MRGLTAGPQHDLTTSSACRGTYQSEVHSQTLPAMSNSPYPFGGNEPTGEVPSYLSRSRFCQGNSPCHELTIAFPSGNSSSPHVNVAPSNPPRAARSHSGSVGNSFPAHRTYASASSLATHSTCGF